MRATSYDQPRCRREHCGGRLYPDADSGELTCLLCGRTPHPLTGEELVHRGPLALITKGLRDGRLQS